MAGRMGNSISHGHWIMGTWISGTADGVRQLMMIYDSHRTPKGHNMLLMITFTYPALVADLALRAHIYLYYIHTRNSPFPLAVIYLGKTNPWCVGPRKGWSVDPGILRAFMEPSDV